MAATELGMPGRQRPTLGEVCGIGCLYDARTDTFLSGHFIFLEPHCAEHLDHPKQSENVQGSRWAQSKGPDGAFWD